MSNVKSIITNNNTRIELEKANHKTLMQITVSVGTSTHAHLQNKCMSKDIVYKATSNTGNTQDTKYFWHDLKHIQRAVQESYQIFHTQKIFERNETFETRLAVKAKQNRFHHKIVLNKKVCFLHGRIQKM